MLQQGIDTFPVRPLELCKRNHWAILSVREFSKRSSYSEDLILEKVIQSPDGAALYSPQEGGYFIVYNDRNDPRRIRWVLAHEIGHILLKHIGEDRPRFNGEQYVAYESEANRFACTLLVPPIVLYKEGIRDIATIQKVFDVEPHVAQLSLLFLHGAYQHMVRDEEKERQLYRAYLRRKHASALLTE